jgi:hypothetical protein
MFSVFGDVTTDSNWHTVLPWRKWKKLFRNSRRHWRQSTSAHSRRLQSSFSQPRGHQNSAVHHVMTSRDWAGILVFVRSHWQRSRQNGPGNAVHICWHQDVPRWSTAQQRTSLFAFEGRGEKIIRKLGISLSTAEPCKTLLGMFIFLGFVSVYWTDGWNPARFTAIQAVLCGTNSVEVSNNKKSSQVLA